VALGRSGSIFAMSLGSVLMGYGVFSLALLIGGRHPLTATLGGVFGCIVLVGLGTRCFFGGRSNLRRLVAEDKNTSGRLIR
jgi:hypothetical protein